MSSIGIHRAANVALILAAVVFAATQVRMWIGGGGVPAGATLRYAEGDVLDLLPKGISMTPEVGRSLLIFINSACVYCTESLPFYARLGELLSESQGAHATVFVVSREPVETTRQYLANVGVILPVAPQLEHGDLPGLKLSPTILLVDSALRVQRVWTGKLDSDREQQVLSVFR
jgi:hypothetical protein